MSVIYPGSDLYHFTHHVSGIFPEDPEPAHGAWGAEEGVVWPF